ncbi:MAG: indole-3-glycerol phosphate synthase TrpC [Desulfobacterales bacterium]|nr:indole-3-glycerol phosphate synthase TrpC [Desulfobacterales bacterium]
MEPSFLQRIVDHKHEEVHAAEKKRPLKILKDIAQQHRTKRPFLETLAAIDSPETIHIIAEIKRASPSKGDLCSELDPAKWAKLYEKGGASALSVLTDTRYFKGSIEDFQKARAVCSLPMLRKEFIISEYQIYESACMEADAILLIVKILSLEQLKDFIGLAQQLNMDALVEVYSLEDLEKAKQAGARLIGINNRNLTNFQTDNQHAIDMASHVDASQVLVSASGMNTRADIDHHLKANIHNFLIGEALVKSANPIQKLQELLKK